MTKSSNDLPKNAPTEDEVVTFYAKAIEYFIKYTQEMMDTQGEGKRRCSATTKSLKKHFTTTNWLERHLPADLRERLPAMSAQLAQSDDRALAIIRNALRKLVEQEILIYKGETHWLNEKYTAINPYFADRVKFVQPARSDPLTGPKAPPTPKDASDITAWRTKAQQKPVADSTKKPTLLN